MNVELEVSPPFYEDITRVSITGAHAEEVVGIVVARLVACDFEVAIEDEDGEFIPFEESSYGT